MGEQLRPGQPKEEKKTEKESPREGGESRRKSQNQASGSNPPESFNGTEIRRLSATCPQTPWSASQEVPWMGHKFKCLQKSGSKDIFATCSPHRYLQHRIFESLV